MARNGKCPTHKRDESFLFVVGQLVIPVAFREAVVVDYDRGHVATHDTAVAVESAFEMLLPELAEPRVAAIEDAAAFDYVPVPLLIATAGVVPSAASAAYFGRSRSQRFKVRVET